MNDWLDGQESISLTRRQWVHVMAALSDTDYTDEIQYEMRQQFIS
jgi:uncharacterized protein (DUF1778 family)